MLDKELRMKIMRNTWAEINLDNILHNLNEARRILPHATKISAVLKANAYGHGAVLVARTLIEGGVDQLSVACLSEALELRRHFKDFPVLVMGYTPDELLRTGVENNVSLTIFSLEQAKKISDIAAELNRKAVIHIKLDTGLNRIGMKPGAETEEEIVSMSRLNNIFIEGIYSHLALRSEETDEAQYNMLVENAERLEKRGVHIPVRHINDSNGMVLYPRFQLDMVRLGGFLFGVTTRGVYKDTITLKPGMSLKSQLTRVSELEDGELVGYGSRFVASGKCRTGTLGLGYSDGYIRSLSGKGTASIKGKPAPVVGVICMDQCMVDLTGVPEAKVGDEVLLFGEDEYDTIQVSDVSNDADTNRNEILANISRRVPRIYIRNSRVADIVDYLLD